MEHKRCFGCMKPKTGGPVCEHCGYKEDSANAVHQLPTSTVLKEQYMVGKVLGQGGFGITYLGWDLYLDIPVAIKEYYPIGMVMRETSVSLEVVGCGGDDGARFRNNKERFLREAKMLARFSQVPEIVQVRNFFLANNTAYIVMEYVEGITLKQYVREQGGKLSVEETLSILGPVVEALSIVHKAGLVHRDISPDNIMMLPGGGAKLLDFGAVRDVGAAAVDKELTKSTEAILKQGYAPIEQYQKRGSLGPWTDVYALCATIYYCLTGEAPADAPERLLMEEELELETKVPELTALQRAALEHGLALRTEQRTGSMQQLQAELLKKEEPKPEPVPAPVPEPIPEPAPEPTPEPVPEPVPAPKTEVKPAPVQQTQTKKHTKAHAKAEDKERTVAYEKREKRKRAETDKDAVTKNVSQQEKKPEPAPAKQTPPVRRKKEKKASSFLPLAALVAMVIIVAALVGNLSGEEEISIPFIDKRITGTCGTDTKWTLDPDTGELVISGTGAMNAVTLSNGVGAPWEEYRDQITAVTVTGEVSAIGENCFYGLENLKTATIGANVKRIRNSAFQNSGLEEVVFQSGEAESSALTEIESNAFRGTALKEITLPEGVQTIGSGAFADCAELLTATVPGKDTMPSFASWEVGVFENAAGDFLLQCCMNTPMSIYGGVMDINMKYTEINSWDVSGQCGDKVSYYLDLSSGVLKLHGTGATWDFKDEYSDENSSRDLPPWSEYKEDIKILVLDDGIANVGEFVFAHCRNLEYIAWCDTLTTISNQAFLDTGMEKVVLPDNVKEIEEWAFNWCYKLKEIHLPESLTALREDAIAECKVLSEVWIGQKTKVSDWKGTPFSTSSDESCTTVYPNLTIYGLQNSDAERLAEKYGYNFVIGARDLRAETEGQCGDDAWWFRSGETLVLYGSGATWKYNLSQEDVDGWAKWEYQSGKAYLGHPGFWEEQKFIRNVVILPGLNELGNGLFFGLQRLRSIDFGTVSRSYAHFSYCTELREVVFPETLKTLGSWSFSGCYSLNKVTFLGATTVEEMAFTGCHGLREIYFTNSGAQIRGELFSSTGTAAEAMMDQLTLYVRKYSAAETYAKKYELNYEILE